MSQRLEKSPPVASHRLTAGLRALVFVSWLVGAGWAFSQGTATEKKPEAKSAPKLEAKKDRPAKSARATVDDDKPPSVEPGPAAKPEKKELSELDSDLKQQLGEKLQVMEEDESNPLLRAGQRMRTVEERLAKQESNSEVGEIQKQIVNDLDELLKQAENPDQDQQKQQKKKKQQKQQKQQQQQQKQQQNQQAQQKESRQEQRQTNTSRASFREGTGKVKEVKNIWGHLGEGLRAEMGNYASDKFLPKYRELLERYYATIAEQSKKR